MGQMTCPKCGCSSPTIPGPCPMCGYNGEPITQRIYRYPLTGACQQKLSLPSGSHLLRAAKVANGTISLYAMVDVDQKNMTDGEVGILGTGWDVPNLPLYAPNNHFMTVVGEEGFVWHIFVRAI